MVIGDNVGRNVHGHFAKYGGGGILVANIYIYIYIYEHHLLLVIFNNSLTILFCLKCHTIYSFIYSLPMLSWSKIIVTALIVTQLSSYHSKAFEIIGGGDNCLPLFIAT
jgi:hypothetical protein